MLDKMLAAKAKLIPKPGQGFNVVGIDSFEIPGTGNELFLAGNYPTRDEAEKEAEKRRTSGERFYVYGPDDA